MLAYQSLTRPSCSPWGTPESVAPKTKVTAHVSCGGTLDDPRFELCEVDTSRGVDHFGWFVVWPVGTNKDETWYFAKREDMKNVKVYTGMMS